MSADFAASLCGYRVDKKGGGAPNVDKPNTSDASDKSSVRLGRALSDALGVPRDMPDGGNTGLALGRAVLDDLQRKFADVPGLIVSTERKIDDFAQYAHLRFGAAQVESSLQDVQAVWDKVKKQLPSGPIETHAEVLDRRLQDHGWLVQLVAQSSAREPLLGLDVSVSSDEADTADPQLLAGLSLKWTLRTDRAQDCRVQGAKLASLRRGRMPHFGVVTMEPRPYMLNIVAGGNGDVDCVYHLALDELVSAVDVAFPRNRSGDQQRRLLDRLIVTGRLKDYTDLYEAI